MFLIFIFSKERRIVIFAKKHIAIELIKQAKFIDFKKIRKDVELLK